MFQRVEMYVNFVFSDIYSIFNNISLFTNYFCIEWRIQQLIERIKQFVILNWSSRNSHWWKESALANGMQKKSSDKSNPPTLQALVISVTSAANQLEADWRWYSLAIHNLNTKIVVNTKWILIKDSKY